jgi:predicted RNA-binding protein with PIN domain
LIKSKKLCGSLKNSVTVVFDGYPGGFDAGHTDGRNAVIFSMDETADEIIKRIIEGAKNKRAIAVVTDDKEIVYCAKYAGCSHIRVEEFLSRATTKCVQEDPKEKNLSKQDLNFSQVNKINEELKKLWLK